MMAADVQVEGGSTSGEEDGSEELVETGRHQPGAGFAQVSGGGDTDEDGRDELTHQQSVPGTFQLESGFCVSASNPPRSKYLMGKYERVPNDDHDITKTRKTGIQVLKKRQR